MGRNKALISVDGRPLWERQYRILSQAGAGEKGVSLRREDDWAPREIPRIFDDGEAGPLGGLLAALEVCTATHLIALAVDLPQLPVSWLDRLRGFCVIGRGAVGWRSEVNAYEPLAAIYPREFFSWARPAALRREFSLQPLLTGAAAAGLFHVETIVPEVQSWFVNWNSPGDVVSP